MKQNFNFYKKLKIVFSVVVFTTALNANSIQEKFDKKYLTKDNSKKVFTHRINKLDDNEIDQFILGKSFFRVPWIEAPSATTARDGLGPLFSANTCISCHPNNSMGSVYNRNNVISRSYVSRLSIPSNKSETHKRLLKYNGFIPEVTYGSQISINGTKNVPFEAKAIVKYKDKIIIYPDSKVIVLSKPLYGVQNQLRDLNYGNLNKDVIITNRIAQSLVGLGLLDKLSDTQILGNQDINDSDNDGISGKANMVYSKSSNSFRLGRYTWKASAYSLNHQVSAAALNDMGLTSSMFPNENCTSIQSKCNDAPKGNSLSANTSFDLTNKRRDAIAFYLKNLKIPKSSVSNKNTEKLFETIGCTSCHISSFTLKNGYKIKPFTDMLLHDMGEELSDGRIEFLANQNEWRTAPLWGIGKKEISLGKKPDFLHDGRAKSLEEAILWHGGEANKSKEKFMNLSEQKRKDIIKYIKEL